MYGRPRPRARQRGVIRQDKTSDGIAQIGPPGFDGIAAKREGGSDLGPAAVRRGRHESRLDLKAKGRWAQERGSDPILAQAMVAQAEHKGRREASHFHAIRAEIRPVKDGGGQGSEERAEALKPSGSTNSGQQGHGP